MTRTLSLFEFINNFMVALSLSPVTTPTRSLPSLDLINLYLQKDQQHVRTIYETLSSSSAIQSNELGGC